MSKFFTDPEISVVFDSDGLFKKNDEWWEKHELMKIRFGIFQKGLMSNRCASVQFKSTHDELLKPFE